MTLRLPLAALLSLIALGPTRAAEPALHVFDFAGNDLPFVYQPYVDQHGEKPVYTFYASDDEGFQMLSSGVKADVAQPCIQMVGKYRAAGLIEPWDVTRIPAVAGIDPQFLATPEVKDAGGLWFLPSVWGASGLVYLTDKVPAADVTSLHIFLDPKYAGRVSLPNSMDDIWALAFLATGVSDVQAVTDAQIDAAADWLRKVHPNVRSYWSDEAELGQAMGSGEVLIAWAWNDLPLLLNRQGYKAAFQREAREGSAEWICGYVNLKDGPGSEDRAYDFVNAALRPENAANFLHEMNFGQANPAAMAALPAAEVAAAGLTPPKGAPLMTTVVTDPAKRERMLTLFEKIKAGF